MSVRQAKDLLGFPRENVEGSVDVLEAVSLGDLANGVVAAAKDKDGSMCILVQQRLEDCVRLDYLVDLNLEVKLSVYVKKSPLKAHLDSKLFGELLCSSSFACTAAIRKLTECK